MHYINIWVSLCQVNPHMFIKFSEIEMQIYSCSGNEFASSKS